MPSSSETSVSARYGGKKKIVIRLQKLKMDILVLDDFQYTDKVFNKEKKTFFIWDENCHLAMCLNLVEPKWSHVTNAVFYLSEMLLLKESSYLECSWILCGQIGQLQIDPMI